MHSRAGWRSCAPRADIGGPWLADAHRRRRDFWRDRCGLELDLVIEADVAKATIEPFGTKVKSKKAPPCDGAGSTVGAEKDQAETLDLMRRRSLRL